MDDRKLRTFLTAIRTGSFSKTAEEMNFSQSAVSQMMNSLESELGCKILERTYSGIKLTAAGEELLPLIVNAETALSQLKKHAEQMAEGESTPIRIGCFASISKAWLPMVLHEYKKLHPETNFEIMVGGYNLIEWLQEGKVDVVLADERMRQGANWYPLFEEDYYAVMPENFVSSRKESIDEAELAKYPIIMDPSNPFHHFLDKPKIDAIKVSVEDDSTLLALVEQCLGATIMPEICLQNIPQNVKVLKLTPAHTRIIGILAVDAPNKATEKFCRYLYKHHSQNEKKVS